MNGIHPGFRQQRGAALVVGLVLLVVLTILAVSGVFTANMELRMVRNSQNQERAFQAAEVAIENALANPMFSTSVPEVQDPIPNPESPDDLYSYTLAHTCVSAPSSGLEGYEIGPSGFSAYHFEVDANGTGPDSAVAEHVQGFFIIGPPDAEHCI